MPRAEKDRRRGPRGISRAQVVDAALAIIDSDGVDALTMRRLADSLGVFPTTIYWHAGNRAELLAHVTHAVMSTIAVPSPGELAWDDWLLDLAHAARDTFRRHPNLAADFASRIHVSSTGMEIADVVLGVLGDAGFEGDGLVHAYNTAMGGIFGWISAEFARRPSGVDDAWETEMRDAVRAASETDLPHLHRHGGSLADRAFMLRWSSGETAPLGDSFDFAMRTLVAGLRSAASATP